MELYAELYVELYIELYIKLYTELCTDIQMYRYVNMQIFVQAIDCKDIYRDGCLYGQL